jgi:hypothetical protein
MALRGAGFPAATVLRLAAPELTSAVDQLIAAEDESQRVLPTAIARLNLEMSQAAADRRAALRKLKQLLLKGNCLILFTGDAAIGAAIRDLELAKTRVAEVRATYNDAAQAATTQVSNVIREVAGNELFREAVTWQAR